MDLFVVPLVAAHQPVPRAEAVIDRLTHGCERVSPRQE
jgi:hypothetical protein